MKENKEEFDQEAYKAQLLNNRMIGWILSFAGTALAIILYVLAHALRS